MNKLFFTVYIRDRRLQVPIAWRENVNNLDQSQ